jgi:hypothetical protein
VTNSQKFQVLEKAVHPRLGPGVVLADNGVNAVFCYPALVGGTEADVLSKDLTPASGAAQGARPVLRPTARKTAETRLKATAFTWRPPEMIPPRRWLYGWHYVRKFASATFAAGGVGKSSLVVAEALAMVSNRDLLGHKPAEQLRVWYWAGEDPLQETERRVAAAMLHYGLKADDIGDRLFIDSGRDTKLVLAQETPRSGVEICEPVVASIIEEIRKNKIDVFIIDPFVSSHAVSENDNGAIDLVAKKWAEIAGQCDCSIELVHHVKKLGGQEATVEDGRGASALLGAVRSARVLNRMSESEATKAGVDNGLRYFRLGGSLSATKANLALPSPGATWFELKSVHLGNGQSELHSDGDSVGVVTRWTWPDPFASVTAGDLLTAQKAVNGGRWRKDYQCKDWVGRPIAKALGLDPDNKADRAKVKAWIATWTENGALVEVEGKDEKRNIRTFVEVGEWASS